MRGCVHWLTARQAQALVTQLPQGQNSEHLTADCAGRELELQSMNAEVPLTLTDEDAGLFTLPDEMSLDPFQLGPQGE